MKNAAGPRIKSTKKLFKNATEKPHLFPINIREYITMMLELPSFTPGGKNGDGGNALSTKERETAIAKRRAEKHNSLKLACSDFFIIKS